MNPSMKRERQKSFKRKPDLLNTAMAVSAGASLSNDHLAAGNGNRRVRGGSLRRENSGGRKDPSYQLAGIHLDNSKNSLLPTSPPTRISDRSLRRSGSVSAAMTGNGGGPRRSRAGSVRHHSYHHHPSHSPRSGSKGRMSRGGSTSSDPTAGSPSNPVPPGGSVDLSVTPQLSPRLFPPAQKSPGSKTSSIAVGGDDVVTLPHAAEDSSLIELQQYIEQHPAVLRVHLDDAFRYVMRASGVQLAVAIAMAVDVALATYTWLDTRDVMFEHVIYILPPATITVAFLIICGLVGVVGIYKHSERNTNNKDTVFKLKAYFILLSMTLIFGNLTLAGSALTALRGMFEHGPSSNIIWFSLPMVGLCSIILVLTSRVILSLYRKGSTEWCPGNVIHFTGIPLESLRSQHRKQLKMHPV